MTQRDDAAVMVLHDPSESDERQSVTRPISSVRSTDEPVHEEALAAAGSEPTAPTVVGDDPPVSSVSSESSELASAADAGRGDRPTLMGLAPVEIGSEVSGSAAEQLNAAHADVEQESDQRAEREPETSTVRPAHWLTSDAEPSAEAADASTGDEQLAAADEEPEQLVAASVSAEPARTPLQISVFMPTPEHAGLPLPRTPEEGESEWLDLSTRWLVTTAPRPVVQQPTPDFVNDETDVSDHAHWADRLAARVAVRTETRSSAPPPPPQLPGTRRATMGYGRPPTGPVTVPVHTNEALGTPAPFDAPNQRQWAPATRRHSTLAGITPLPEDPNAWSQARDSREFAAASASEAPRSRAPNAEPNPWREEPSYSDATPRPQSAGQGHGPGPSTTAASYAAPAGALPPPWAATMSPYAAAPPAAMMPPYAPASWNAPPVPPPWAAPQYTPGERRPSRTPTRDYALPPGAASSTANMRPVRVPQHYGNEISFEQWKGMANTWFMTVGKLALAGMALHFSGLATPLLANFGYAPANEHLLRPAVQTASIAAAGVMPEAVVPEPLAKEKEEAEPVAAPAPRRWGAKREPNPTTPSTAEPASRRRGTKPAHKAKPKSSARSKPARSAEVEAPAAVAAAPAAAALPAVSAEPEPLAAAATKSEEAAGEATVRINSRPWSEIYIDGTHVGHTPKLDLRVSAGSHRVRLVNQELGLSKTFELNAPAGETVSHVELFIE